MPFTACDDQIVVIPHVRDLALLSDDELLARQVEIAGARRHVDAAAASVASEIARRSRPDLGYTGLAQRTGARTPDRLIASVTGLSVGESRAMITAGEALDGETSWMAPVAIALQTGEVSVGATAAIRRGLGEPTADVSADHLAVAAQRLVDESGDLPPEQVAILAREARDRIDADGVADREAALREKRSLRVSRLPDGMTRLVALLDPENAAFVTDAIDRVTAPRRGGVRFVDPDEKQRAEDIIADTRTTEQLAFDAFVMMIRLAAAVDDGRVFGSRAPEVRVHVRAEHLSSGQGFGWIEGQSTMTSLGTVERLICTVGALPIAFLDDGRPMKLGRSQRLFSAAQRIALAARDGGCLIPGCDRPPSWCEAHHIDEWGEHLGDTDVDTGVLLCRHHHMWVHDTGARIARAAGGFEVRRAGQVPIRLVSKNPLRRQIRQESVEVASSMRTSA
jgi:hypothetical protein